jgi:GDP-4-dehydro-6-deoxy-D-mannose reductase
MRALVIGADGFAGRWLVDHLRASGDSVVALVGPRFRPPLDGVESIDKEDVRDGDAMATVVGTAQPEAVFYLAGISRQGERDDFSASIGVSVVGSMNALMACSRVSPRPRFLFVSTGYVYRPGPDPLNEDSSIEPDSIYAAGKLVAEHGLLEVAPHAGVDVVIARPFNHIGPGQSDAFLIPTLARHVAAAAAGGDPEIRVADSSVVRDFTDVRDVVRGYRLVAERGVAGSVYNIASGHGVSVTQVAEVMAQETNTAIELVSEAAPRHEEVSVLIGDASRLESLGWRREYQLRTTLADVLRSYSRSATPDR